MKRTTLAVLMLALALVALAAPLAYAQAPAPKVTINGLIDNVRGDLLLQEAMEFLKDKAIVEETEPEAEHCDTHSK